MTILCNAVHVRHGRCVLAIGHECSHIWADSGDYGALLSRLNELEAQLAAIQGPKLPISS